MRLVVVHDFAHSSLGGGATRCAIDGALSFAEAGVPVTFFAASGEPDPELVQAGIDVITLRQEDIRRNGNRLAAVRRGVWNNVAADRLRELVRKADLGSTVFHVHTWSKALSPAVLKPLVEPGVRSVFHLHEYFAACPNGGFFVYPRLEVCHRRPLSFDCVSTNCDSRSMAHKLWRVGRQLTVHAFGDYPRRARHFLVLSELQRHVLGPYLPDEASVHLTRNPVDVVELPLLERHADARFLYVGRLSPEKGTEVLVRAFRDRSHQLVVIGEGPDLERAKAGLPDADFRGWRSPAEVQDAMREARALIFPSIWYEGMPMVVIEALANGLPVITSDASSACEVVEHSRTGLIFPSGDADQLAAACDRLSSPEAVAAMSRDAYTKYWADPFSRDRFRGQMTAVYQQVLDARP